jgi:hypothetical protein
MNETWTLIRLSLLSISGLSLVFAVLGVWIRKEEMARFDF